MPKRLSHTIYVGNLPGDIREREVEDLFYKYGPIVEIDLKIPPRPPGYAFVEFEDDRDAEDAVYGRNNYDFDGHRLRVEFAHGGRSSLDTHSSYSSSSYRGGVPKHTDYRVMVTGLPSSASWQDLKDHMRRAGEVCFSDVYKDRRYGGMIGVVDYASYDDMKRAVRKLDDTEFRNAFSRAYIRVKEYNSSPAYRSRSRSRSYSHERSYSRSPSCSRSYSISPRRYSRRSYSRSPSVSLSRSRSLSRSLSSFLCFIAQAHQCGDWTWGLGLSGTGFELFIEARNLYWKSSAKLIFSRVHNVAQPGKDPDPFMICIKVTDSRAAQLEQKQ